MPIIAVITLPIIIPKIKTVMISFNLLITDSKIPKTAREPNIAAAISPEFVENEIDEAEIPKKDNPMMKMATPKPAPELIPKMYGPAKGFLKSVCICSPQTERALPHKIAAIALGNLDCMMMMVQLSFSTDFPIKMLKILLKGMLTEPKNRSKLKKKTIPVIKIRRVALILFICKKFIRKTKVNF